MTEVAQVFRVFNFRYSRNHDWPCDIYSRVIGDTGIESELITQRNRNGDDGISAMLLFTNFRFCCGDTKNRRLFAATSTNERSFCCHGVIRYT